jgi:hypothetical protein
VKGPVLNTSEVVSARFVLDVIWEDVSSSDVVSTKVVDVSSPVVPISEAVVGAVLPCSVVLGGREVKISVDVVRGRVKGPEEKVSEAVAVAVEVGRELVVSGGVNGAEVNEGVVVLVCGPKVVWGDVSVVNSSGVDSAGVSEWLKNIVVVECGISRVVEIGGLLGCVVLRTTGIVVNCVVLNGGRVNG